MEHISGPIERLMKKKFKLTAPIPTEADEQIRLVTWCRFHAPRFPDLKLLYAVPNGAIAGPGRFQIVIWMKNMGLVNGVPDLVLPVRRPPFGGLYLEMKRSKGGKPSPDQEWWIAELSKQNYMVVVCKGFDEGRKAICDYLEIAP
jgi:hypothetical protein